MKSHEHNHNPIKKEFFDEAPFLAGFDPITEKKGSIPPHYFSEFPEKMMRRITENQQQNSKVVSLEKENKSGNSWYAYFAPQHAMAASIFFAILVWSVFHYKTPSPSMQVLSGIAPLEVQEYLIRHADEVDESLIHSLAENNPIETIEKNQITLYLEENLSPEEIEEI